MKYLKNLFPFLFILFMQNRLIAQNVMLNVLTLNSGIVQKGKQSFLEVSLTNTNSTNFVGIYKLKVQISIPADIIRFDSIGHQLPNGWKIINTIGATMLLSNGMDMIAATDNRTLLIAFKGIKPGGPATLSGQLSFADGTAPGTSAGILKGDLLSDNFSTTTCKVIQ